MGGFENHTCPRHTQSSHHATMSGYNLPVAGFHLPFYWESLHFSRTQCCWAGPDWFLERSQWGRENLFYQNSPTRAYFWKSILPVKADMTFLHKHANNPCFELGWWNTRRFPCRGMGANYRCEVPWELFKDCKQHKKAQLQIFHGYFTCMLLFVLFLNES